MSEGEVVELSEEEIVEIDLDTVEEPEQQVIEQVVAENEEDEDAAAGTKVAKPKRVIRNPQPKLNAEKLRSDRGLSALESYFERVKFKGKGYEEEDLAVILKTYEYWCHRLFPRYPFDECISKIETLGTKRPVLTHIKKMRLNLLYEEPNLNNAEIVNTPNDQFDDLIQTPISPPRTELSEEQMERIRLNKERAERIRQEKLRQRELGQCSQDTSAEASRGEIAVVEEISQGESGQCSQDTSAEATSGENAVVEEISEGKSDQCSQDTSAEATSGENAVVEEISQGESISQSYIISDEENTSEVSQPMGTSEIADPVDDTVIPSTSPLSGVKRRLVVLSDSDED